MDAKDWLLVLAALVIFGGPIGHTVWRRTKGDVGVRPKTDLGDQYLIDDPARMGAAITAYGGKAFAAGAKLLKRGAMRTVADNERRQQQMVGGQAS